MSKVSPGSPLPANFFFFQSLEDTLCSQKVEFSLSFIFGYYNSDIICKIFYASNYCCALKKYFWLEIYIFFSLPNLLSSYSISLYPSFLPSLPPSPSLFFFFTCLTCKQIQGFSLIVISLIHDSEIGRLQKSI